jgi:hypothetical protein
MRVCARSLECVQIWVEPREHSLVPNGKREFFFFDGHDSQRCKCRGLPRRGGVVTRVRRTRDGARTAGPAKWRETERSFVATIDVYHYARSEDLDAISEEGLKPGSRSMVMDSSLRNNSVFAWLAPDFDVLGYNENPRYVCLRAKVDVSRCRIAAFELAQAAYSNHIGRGQARNPEGAARLLAAYEKSSMPVDQHTLGTFRTPEVLVDGEISPDDIAVVRSPETGTRGEENRRVYAARWSEHLIRVLSIQRTLMQLQELRDAAVNRGVAARVAKHDDATAYLETYMLVESGEFFTVEDED